MEQGGGLSADSYGLRGGSGSRDSHYAQPPLIVTAHRPFARGKPRRVFGCDSPRVMVKQARGRSASPRPKFKVPPAVNLPH